MSDLLKQMLAVLRELQPPNAPMGGGRLFTATKFPSSQFHRLGRDSVGHIAVLLAIDPANQDGPLPPVVLENINVLHAAKCRISDADGNLESGVYTVISCTSDDKSLVRHFVTLMSSIVMSLPELPTCHTASTAIQRMIRLFRSLKRPSSRSIQGLWGELFVIKIALDARILVRAWRSDPMEQFDFADLNDRLEVKSTKRARRSHHFSLLQVRPQDDTRVIIASLQVAPLANGLSLSRLWHDVRARVEEDAKLLLHVDQVVTTSLGRTWRRGLNVAFDESIARRSIEYYEASSIPAIEGALPTEVTEVKFRCDLSGVVAMSPEAVQNASPFFRAAKGVLPLYNF